MRTVQKKVCLLGDFAVGKTSLIRRFVEGKFDEEIKRVIPQAPFVLLGDKADLLDLRSISPIDLDTISQQLSAPFLLTSAKSGDNVETAFTLLAEHIET